MRKNNEYTLDDLIYTAADLLAIATANELNETDEFEGTLDRDSKQLLRDNLFQSIKELYNSCQISYGLVLRSNHGLNYHIKNSLREMGFEKLPGKDEFKPHILVNILHNEKRLDVFDISFSKDEHENMIEKADPINFKMKKATNHARVNFYKKHKKCKLVANQYA